MTPLPGSLRLLLLACAGVSTFYVAAHWSGAQGDSRNGLVEAVVRAAPRGTDPTTTRVAMATPPVAPETDAVPRVAERPRSIPKAGRDPFTNLSWVPPPPPPAPMPRQAPPPRPPEPVAPPLPFAFIGMLERGGTAKPEVFLARGDVLFVVSAGDLLDNKTYRIDSLSAQEVVMTYLPLNTPQKLKLSTGTP